ncbi:MAG TPA: transposase [candidate division Zixibacteria bacterium]|jgi:REP element-mobilizing transposase RayT
MAGSTTQTRRSLRLRDYDYAQPGAYFVTVCAYRQQHTFGTIDGEKTSLNDYGLIVRDEWLKTGTLRPGIQLDEYVIMPSHLHGIIVIPPSTEEGTARRAPTPEAFGRPVPGSIPTIVRSFKSAVTRRVCEEAGGQRIAVWQRGFYDHIIRTEADLHRIRGYIRTNPLALSLKSVAEDTSGV